MFPRKNIINAIHLQGSRTTSSRVTKYHILTTLDGVNWEAYNWKNNGSRLRIFDGPSTGPDEPPVISYLNPPVVAIGLRIVVDDYVTAPVARFGFKGCSYEDSVLKTPIPPVKIRVGNSSPNGDATVADSQSQCGTTAVQIPYGKKAIFTCSPPITGRYLSVVGNTVADQDMVVSALRAYNAKEPNLAFSKVVTASSDITGGVELTLTDGDQNSAGVGSDSPSLWFRLDLGSTENLISKVTLVTSEDGWSPMYYPTTSNLLQTKTRCDDDPTVTLSCPANEIIFIHGSYVANKDAGVCGNWLTCPGDNSPTLMNGVKNACHLKQTCTLPSHGDYVGYDACPNILKTHGIDYLCINRK